MAKALKIGATIVGIAALTVVTAGAAAGLIAGVGIATGVSAATAMIGVSASTLFLASAGMSVAGSLLAPKPKAPVTSPSTVERLQASLNPSTPRVTVFGRTAMATDIRDQEYTDGQAYLHRFIVVASHRVHAISELWFDDKRVWTAAGGVEGEAAGYLTVTPILEGSAANAINISPRMGSSRRFTGCAYLHLRYKLTGNSKKAESPFAQSIPSRVTVRGDGALVYDPRLDSSAGGSGPQRATDQTTWAWSDGAARNPALQILWWLLGWRVQNPVTGVWKLMVGKGIAVDRIDLASFIAAANLCDETVAIAAGGSEPRYRSDGTVSEGDDLNAVLGELKAACNGTIDDVDGRIRISILHNDLALPGPALTTADVLGEFTWTQTQPLDQSFNVIRGRYTDPSDRALYQLVDYREVRTASPDGMDRIQSIDLGKVQSHSQTQRLTRLRLQRAVSGGGTFEAVFQATAWRYQKGDVVPFSFDPLGFTTKLFRVARMTIRPDGRVPMLLREESAALYAGDGNDAAPITPAAPTVYSSSLNPIVQGIDDAEGAADAAQAAANAAQEAGGAALAKIAIIQSDGWLSAGEKPDIIRRRADAANEVDALQARAAGAGVSAAAYMGAYNALGAYLNTLTPAWNNTALDTAIVPATFNGRWSDYYYARTLLLSAIAEAMRGATLGDNLRDSRGEVVLDLDVLNPQSLTPIGAYTVVKGDVTYKEGGTNGAWQGGARGEALTGSAFVSSGFISYQGGDWITVLALDASPTTVVPSEQKVWASLVHTGLETATLYVGNYGLDGPAFYLTGLSGRPRPSLVYDGTQAYVELGGKRYGSVELPPGEVFYPKFLDYYRNGTDYTASVEYLRRDCRYGTWTDQSLAANPRSNTFTDPNNAFDIFGNRFKLKPGRPPWTGNVYTREAYRGACIASGRIDPSTGSVIFGLTDTTSGIASSSFTELDFSIQADAGSGALYVYESGVGVSLGGAAGVNDSLAVYYNGADVLYLLNGEVLRRVKTTANRRFFGAVAGGGAILHDFRFEAAGDATIPGQAQAFLDRAQQTITADYQGNVTGSFPSFIPTVLRNSTSIRAEGYVTYEVVKASDGVTGGADGGTVSLATAGSGKGIVTPTGFASGSNTIKWILLVTVDGVLVRRISCSLAKDIAAPPVGGGGSGGGGGGGSSGAIRPHDQQADNSYVPASSGGAASIVLTSGQALRAQLYGTYAATYGSAAMRSGFYLNQYSSDGVTWYNFPGGEVYGTEASGGGGGWEVTIPTDPVDGSINFDQSVPGLSAGTWQVRTMMRCSQASNGIVATSGQIAYDAVTP